MSRADLHVHSRYSTNPADVMLKKFGSQESYTEVSDVVLAARERGMDWVTITDHNAIGGTLELVRQYPQEAFTGVEMTVVFPEDGCTVHILVYDFTEAQFKAFEALRHDIYKFRDYLKEERLAYSVAHASYSVNGRLALAHIERLILLFNVFETINGARVAVYNDLLKRVLQSLTPGKMEALRRKHSIVPMGDTPWVKSFTGGSDEHAGLFIGDTWTEAPGKSKEDFLKALRAGQTDSGGRSNHYKTQVYTFLKIAWQYSKTRRGSLAKKVFNELCAAIFEGKRLGWKTQLKIEQLKRSRKPNIRRIASSVNVLAKRLAQDTAMPHQERIDLIYATVAGIEDAFFVENFDAFREGFAGGDLLRLVSSLTAVFRSLFLSLPFLGTFRHLHQSSALMDEVREAFLGAIPPEEKKILWFTDTLDDLNGVSVTLKAFAREAAARGRSLRLVTGAVSGLSPQEGRVELPVVYEYVPEFYPGYCLRVPSLLKALELVFAEGPTEIIISTPGPVGLIGILAARLFGVPCRGVYHTDFTRMTELGLSGGSMAGVVRGYVRWFYERMDEVLVPTKTTARLLEFQGHEPGNLRLFRRGIDTFAMDVNPGERSGGRACYSIDSAFTLLYAGRVSRDKNLGLLACVYRQIADRNEEVNLIIAGDGPMLEEMKHLLAGCSRVHFLGKMASGDMPQVYALADIFIFPSTMDTFSMAVLEAQACGVPAMVTDVGGPQELILPGVTGWVLPSNDTQAWVNAILKTKQLVQGAFDKLTAMQQASRRHVKDCFSWDDAITALYERRPKI